MAHVLDKDTTPQRDQSQDTDHCKHIKEAAGSPKRSGTLMHWEDGSPPDLSRIFCFLHVMISQAKGGLWIQGHGLILTQIP